MGAGPRVAFLADGLVVGGAERVVQALAVGLRERGWSSVVGCLRGPGPIGTELREAGVTVESGLGPARHDPTNVRRILGFLRRHAVDLVHVLDHSNVLAHGRVAAALAGLPQVCAVHRTRRADGSPSLGLADRALMGLSRRVLAVSRGQAEYLHREQGIALDRLVVVYNGVDPRRFAPSPRARARVRAALGLDDRTPLVAVVAALRPEKNHELLLRALAAVPDARVTLAVVGGGDREPDLRRRAEGLGLGARVLWLGRRDDVPDLLAAADLSVLPSHPNVETFPLGVLESMSCEVPVVATDVGSVREMIVDGIEGRIVAPGDAPGLAAAMDAFLADPEARRRAGRRARATVLARFTVDAMVERTADVFGRLLEDRV